ncbi:MAG TPA: DNA internalization-related competence protein ComEC/Rec2 [Deltaproteobacteria bacterium]|nr:DNA internalization-related competence protein ComEC/Rec2 [Deltaproteobacteria bacterium]
MRREIFQRYPLLLPALGMIFGIYLRAARPGQGFWIPLSLAIFSALGAVRLPPSWRNLALFSLGLALGCLRTAAQWPSAPSAELAAALSEKRSLQVDFRMEEYPSCDRRRCQVRVRLDNGSKILLKVWQPGLAAVPGEVYRAFLRFSRSKRFRNPYSFDYPRYLKRQGISLLASVPELPPAARLREASWLHRKAAALRRQVAAQIRSALPPGPARGVMAALLLGDKQELPAATEEDFRRSGLTHVLVVSGLHFTLVWAFCFFPCWGLLSLFPRLADRGTARVLAVALAAVPTLFYALLVGLTPSVLRSLGTASIFALTLGLKWRKNFASSLLLIGGILLLVRPLFLFDLSFQLSFASVAAIYFLTKAFREWLKRKQAEFPLFRYAALRWTLLSFYSTGAVNFALFPLLALSFHEISLLAPLANWLGVPFFASFLLPAEGMAALAASAFPRMAGLWTVLGKLVDPALRLLHFFADFPWATLWVGPLPIYFWAAYLLFLALGLGLIRKRFFLYLAAGCLLFALCGRRAPLENHGIGLTMFDVGQGDSLLLSLPDGEAILIDGGGFPFSDFDVGRNVLLPELLGRGLRRLSAVVLTHPDADHWKGLKFLAERFSVGEFWVGPGSLEHRDFAVLRSIIEKRKIPLRILEQGAKWFQGGAELEVLWPSRAAALAADSDNNRSLVLRVCHQGRCLLLTGDIEAEAEAALLQSLRDKAVEILKVAHHGSRTSSTSEFLQVLQPRQALISVGAGNSYRLPNPEVLKRLEGVGAQILRTDLQGQVEVRLEEALKAPPIPSRWSSIRRVQVESSSDRHKTSRRE